MVRFCRRLAGIVVVWGLLAFGEPAAEVQGKYPDRAVKIIVPIGPGGSYDLVGRHLAEALSKRTGQAFFVENKPGARTGGGHQGGGHRLRRRGTPSAIRGWSAASPTWPSIRRCIRSSATIRSGISCRSRWSTS